MNRLQNLIESIACPTCEGRGSKPRKSFGIRKCSACEGSGIRPSLRRHRLTLVEVVKRAYAFGLHDGVGAMGVEKRSILSRNPAAGEP